MQLAPEVRYFTGPAHLANELVSGAHVSNEFDSKLADACRRAVAPGKLVAFDPEVINARLSLGPVQYSGHCVRFTVHQRY